MLSRMNINLVMSCTESIIYCYDKPGWSQGMVLSAVNGVGLALVIPNAQSITADYYDELDRGKAFGALYMTSALGGAFGSLYATNQGQHFSFLVCYMVVLPFHSKTS